MTPRALFFFAGMVISAVLSGASDTLAAMPRIAVAAFGLACAILARRVAANPARAALALVLGVTLGLTLPRDALLRAGPVLTKSPGGFRAGDLFVLLDRLDDNPKALLEQRVSVSGEWTPSAQNRYATVSRRVMTCCAADALDVGFDVLPAAPTRIAGGAQVRVTGVLRTRLVRGELRYMLADAVVRERR